MSESESISSLPLLIVKKCRAAHCRYWPLEEIVKSESWSNGYCRACVRLKKQQSKAWQKANPEKVRRSIRQARRDPARREKIKAKEKGRRLRQRLFRPDVAKALTLRKTAARRERMKNGTATLKDIQRLKNSAESCQYCGRPFGISEIKTADHIIPLSRGGPHSMENIVAACKGCNEKKGTKTIWEWAMEVGDFLVPRWRYVRKIS